MAQNGDVLMTGVMPLQFMRKLCSISAQDAAIIIYIAIICTINYLGAILIAINSIWTWLFIIIIDYISFLDFYFVKLYQPILSLQKLNSYISLY